MGISASDVYARILKIEKLNNSEDISYPYRDHLKRKLKISPGQVTARLFFHILLFIVEVSQLFSHFPGEMSSSNINRTGSITWDQ